MHRYVTWALTQMSVDPLMRVGATSDLPARSREQYRITSGRFVMDAAHGLFCFASVER